MNDTRLPADDARTPVPKRQPENRPLDQVRDGLPALTLRAAIAEEVHNAITAYTLNDGAGHCLLYAYVGALVTSRVTGQRYLPFAGSLRLIVARDGVGWLLDARQGGLRRQEFHAWFGREHADGRIELVDLAARHYKRLLERSHASDEQPRPVWDREDPPPYLWTFLTDLPSWVRLTPVVETMWETAHALEPGMAAIQRIATAAQHRLIHKIPKGLFHK
jgi:hypothetical protein